MKTFFTALLLLASHTSLADANFKTCIGKSYENKGDVLEIELIGNEQGIYVETESRFFPSGVYQNFSTSAVSVTLDATPSILLRRLASRSDYRMADLLVNKELLQSNKGGQIKVVRESSSTSDLLYLCIPENRKPQK